MRATEKEATTLADMSVHAMDWGVGRANSKTMQKYGKYLGGLIVLGFIIPQIALAAWWNPFTWNLSSWFSKPTSPVSQQQTSATTTDLLSQPNTVNPPSKVKNASGNNQPAHTDASIKPAQPTQKTFTLPSGAVIDSNGKVITPASQDEQASTQPQTRTAIQAGTLCNGVRYSSCSNGSTFICPNDGSAAYCQPPQSQKDAQAAALMAEYNAKKNALDQQIIDIKTKYYSDLNAAKNFGDTLDAYNGYINELTNTANAKIQMVQTQEEQLRLNYLQKLQAL